MKLSEARALLPPDEQDISDEELSALLGQLYEFSDLVIDIYLERKEGGPMRDPR